MPAFPIKPDSAFPLQGLLGIADVMFPSFPEMHAVNDAIDRVIADVRVQALNQRVQLDCGERALGKEEQDSLR